MPPPEPALLVANWVQIYLPQEDVSLVEVELACVHAPTHRDHANWDVAVASGMIGRFHMHGGNEQLQQSDSDGHNLCSVHICNDVLHTCCWTCCCHNEVSVLQFICCHPLLLHVVNDATSGIIS